MRKGLWVSRARLILLPLQEPSVMLRPRTSALQLRGVCSRSTLFRGWHAPWPDVGPPRDLRGGKARPELARGAARRTLRRGPPGAGESAACLPVMLRAAAPGAARGPCTVRAGIEHTGTALSPATDRPGGAGAHPATVRKAAPWLELTPAAWAPARCHQCAACLLNSMCEWGAAGHLQMPRNEAGLRQPLRQHGRAGTAELHRQAECVAWAPRCNSYAIPWPGFT